jgi:Fanconi anemia group J protein
MSEGMNFSDAMARGVIVIGIPYPNVKDIRIKMKRKYNDDYSESRSLLTGSEWYNIQAYRSLNQGFYSMYSQISSWAMYSTPRRLGYCCFSFILLGAIVLLDVRFMSDNSRLSKWVQSYIQKFHAFGEAQEQLSEFFKKCQQRQEKKENIKMEKMSLREKV